MIQRQLRKTLACVVVAAFGLAPPVCAAEEPARRPNFLVIVADDLGWADLGCYGNRFIETPNINRLAGEGVRFTDAYAAAPVCTPTRVSLFCGQAPARVGAYKVPFPGNDCPWGRITPPPPWGDKPANGTTLGAALSAAGYACAIFGKTHVPKAILEAVAVDPVHSAADGLLPTEFRAELKRFERENPQKNVGAITSRAIQFMAAHRDCPFCCFVAHHAPHVPLDARPSLRKKYEAKILSQNTLGAGLPTPPERVTEGLPRRFGISSKWKTQPTPIHPHYAAMCEALDESAGLLVRAVARLGLADRTAVLFVSDNGGCVKVFRDGKGEQVTSNAPLRGQKGGLYEGGIRVPLIVKWPGAAKPGSECPTPVITTDLTPTLAEMAGAPISENFVLDGMSLVPLLKGEGSLPRDSLYFYFPDYHHDFPALAARRGDWKLIESAEDGHLELYNLIDDIGERHNLAASLPDKAAQMRDALHRWRKSVGAPLPAPNPNYDPARSSILQPSAEKTRQQFLPQPWSTNNITKAKTRKP